MTTLARIGSLLVLAVALCVVSGCARAAAPKHDWSGFLEDYSRLRLGGTNDLPYVYRNDAARWSEYDQVLFEPVTLWRSGKDSLAPIPEEELLKLVAHFERAVRMRLGAGFRLVTDPAPRTLRLRLAITEARASDKAVDVMTALAEDVAAPAGTGPLPPALVPFVAAAVVEGELRDAVTNELLAQGIDNRRAGAPPTITTWEALDRALAFWADRVCSRLEARTRPR